MTRKQATIAVRSGLNDDEQYGCVVPPIHLSSTYNFTGFNEPRAHDYSRRGNPTRDVVQRALAELEGGAGAVLTNTGMSAIHLVTTVFLKPGDLLVAPHDCYGGSYRLFDSLAKRGCYRVLFVDQGDEQALRAALAEKPKLVLVESPSNPLLRVVDIAKICHLAREVGAVSVVDNTFLSPALQNPLALGADLVLHSCTKYLNGHSDVVAGVVIAKDPDVVTELAWWANNIGVTGGAFDSYLLLRGLRTLVPRMELAQRNAQAIVKYLQTQPLVKKLYHPSLPENQGHEIAARQQKGFGAMLSFELDGDEQTLRRFLGGLSLFTLAESLGGVESLISHAATMTHAGMAPEARAAAGISETLLRISTGIEDGEDLTFATQKSKISLSDMDYVSWRRDLVADLERLELLLLMLKDITPQHDSKLQMLIEDLKQKFAHPINGENKKVLIFTAFADTANYLYEQLAPRIKEACGLDTALITGSTEGKCTIPKFPMSFNNVLTYFSPLSKDRAALFPNAKGEIDVLIATDCISEGQNLQDCDYLINYDIHWNPVRIIQRFGRIDRIGSQNKQIQLVNYWPDMELDDYIKLKGRVESRMKATILTAAGTGNPLSVGEEADLEYRLGQLKKLQNEVVDIEDMDTGINIMDLGLNEFRLDLLQYIKEHPDIEHAPFGLNAVVASSDLAKPGVMFVLKNRNNAVNIDRKNQLHPFYMVYLADDGEVVCDHLHPKQLLDTMRALCKNRNDYDRALCALVNRETKDGRQMTQYNTLLQTAIDSIVSIKEETDIESLFSVGETTALKGEIKGLDDFELITFLIIKEA